MECFINKIFHDKTDEFVHVQFQKFSRGIFKDRALIKALRTGKGFSVATSNEYANELVRACAEKLSGGKARITGVIVSTLNLKDKLPCLDIKQFMGVKQHVIDAELSGNEIIKLQDAIPGAFFALSFSFDDVGLKIKPKAPKSARPKTSDGLPKADFCRLKTTDEGLIDKFVIEKGWKNLEVRHDFIIDDIEVNEDVKDFNEMRRLAKRKGKIVRKAVVDGRETIEEKDFVA